MSPTDREADGSVVNLHVLQHLLQRVGRPRLQLGGGRRRRPPSQVRSDGGQVGDTVRTAAGLG